MVIAWDAFTEIVNVLPDGWQYPEICAAKIVFDGRAFQSSHYRGSPDKQRTSFSLRDRRAGEIEVVYLKRMKTQDEGPFLKEERHLINSI